MTCSNFDTSGFNFHFTQRYSLTTFLVSFKAPSPVETDPCNPSPCGVNTRCDNGVCYCLPEYFGNPNAGCRPECVLNTDCSSNRACIRNKCVDPCANACGQGAICEVFNHIPMCSCPSGTTGSALISCQIFKGTFIYQTSFALLYNPSKFQSVETFTNWYQWLNFRYESVIFTGESISLIDSLVDNNWLIARSQSLIIISTKLNQLKFREGSSTNYVTPFETIQPIEVFLNNEVKVK